MPAEVNGHSSNQGVGAGPIEKAADNEPPSESDGSSDEDEDEPPLLKYTRLSQLPPTFFTEDPVSAHFFHESVFVFGTHSGQIHLTNTALEPIRTLKVQKASILSLYCDGSFFASGLMDGTVLVGSVSDETDLKMFHYKRPIHAVVLDKNYYRSRALVCGGMSGEVVYQSKNWLDKFVESILDKDNGPIVAIQTIDDLILWLNDKGITVYHITTRLVITVIPKPDNAPRADLYWPRITFPETDRVLIAWGSYIWSLRVSMKMPLDNASGSLKSRYLPSAASFSFRGQQEKKVEVEHIFKVPFLVSGIASFKNDLWLVLAYNPPSEKEGRRYPHNPDLKLISCTDGSIAYEEEIEFENKENLGLNDYNLGTHIGSSIRHFIISARGGVIAQHVDIEDRLQWFVDREQYEEAWKMSQHLLSPVKRLKLGVKHAESLVDSNLWEQAALWLSLLLYVNLDKFPNHDTVSTIGTKASGALQADDEALLREVGAQWAHWSRVFIEGGQVPLLTSIIPTDPRWALPKSCYNEVLEFWLDSDVGTLLELLGKWSPEIYSPGDLAEKIEPQLKEDESTPLRKELCKLYEMLAEPGKAVPHLILLRDPNIIPFLADNHILTHFTENLPTFATYRFEGDEIERLPVPALREKLSDLVLIFVDYRHDINPHAIITEMKHSHLDVVAFFYLERLKEVDEMMVADFENEQVSLLALYDRPSLLPYLTSHERYDYAVAIEVCEENALMDELIYLLGKVGDIKKALRLIMEELDDPQRAIQFAKRQNSKETWNMLLEHSFTRPEFLNALIELADNQSEKFYNPITILERMNTSANIAGLKESVTKVAHDQELSLLSTQLILKIVYKRSEEVSKVYYLGKLAGCEIDTAEWSSVLETYDTVLVLQNGTPKAPLVELRLELAVVANHKKVPFTTLKLKIEHIKALSDHFASMQRD